MINKPCSLLFKRAELIYHIDNANIMYAPVIMLKDYNIHIIEVEEAFTCPICYTLGILGESRLYYHCPSHGIICQQDLMIYFTLSEHVIPTIENKGWVRRTGKEVRSGRYGLVQKVEEYKKLEEEFWLNREQKSVLQESDEIYAVSLNQLFHILHSR